MKNQVRAYYAEAIWFHEEYIPTMEEYMRVALVTAGYTVVTTLSLMGMGDVVTKETFEWVAGDPRIISSSNLMARLMDDIKSHKVCRICASNCKSIGSIQSLFLKTVSCSQKQ